MTGAIATETGAEISVYPQVDLETGEETGKWLMHLSMQDPNDTRFAAVMLTDEEKRELAFALLGYDPPAPREHLCIDHTGKPGSREHCCLAEWKAAGA
jgi:hypothetical protein